VNTLQLVSVRQRYGHQPVLDGVDLDVEQGSFTAVLGASGSGKTTLLRVIAGFERIESGVVRLGDTMFDNGRTSLAPERRRIGYVPQDGALFPHLRVAANVGFGLSRSGRKQARSDRKRISALLDAVGLTGFERRYPHQLSGGQQQRVALARALAIEPEVVLLDEPFSSLDAAMRASVRREVAQTLRDRGTTTVLVTHDQDEALSMADRVAVLRDGRIVVNSRPEELYRSPVDADLAGFLGEANLLPGTIEGGVARTALGRLVLQDQVAAGWTGDDAAAVVLVRPEQLEVRSRTAVPAGGGIAARVVDRAFFGHDAVLRVTPSVLADHDPLLVRVTGPGAPLPGTDVLLTVRAPVMAWPASQPSRARREAAGDATCPPAGQGSSAAAPGSPPGDGSAPSVAAPVRR
jgi:iron(III) transport system ATP-binding protein